MKKSLKWPSVSLIVLNWNGKRVIKNCLDTLLKTSYPNYKVIVVDNASTDGSVEYIKRYYPEITVLKNPRNLGFAHAHNQAIHLSKRCFRA